MDKNGFIGFNEGAEAFRELVNVVRSPYIPGEGGFPPGAPRNPPLGEFANRVADAVIDNQNKAALGFGANANQVGGNHYKEKAIQPWDFIIQNKLGYLEGNVVKYVSRHKAKGGLEDLKKARHYLDKLIEAEKEELVRGKYIL